MNVNTQSCQIRRCSIFDSNTTQRHIHLSLIVTVTAHLLQPSFTRMTITQHPVLSGRQLSLLLSKHYIILSNGCGTPASLSVVPLSSLLLSPCYCFPIPSSTMAISTPRHDSSRIPVKTLLIIERLFVLITIFRISGRDRDGNYPGRQPSMSHRAL